ncbi:hypothetical protein [Methanobrevibacter sp.]|uniref:hypothetical protein n=1 Tax=Methanobrevibacter sp. TaxID=66852 RepID=UPI00263983C9|nr:hypothetical protein [uncultured Methanobrevibacter sp.]
MSTNEKTKIKFDILNKINEILEQNQIQKIDKLTTVNSSINTSYLGNIQVFDENKVESISSKLDEIFNEYGTCSLRTEEVTSCCKPPYKNLSFKINISNKD